MLKAIVTALFVLLLPVVASAQAQPPIVPANTPLTLKADHPGADGYRLYIDGVKVADVAKTANVAGVVTTPVPPQLPGPHVIELSAVWGAGEYKSLPFLFVADSVPAPSNLSITWTMTFTVPATPPATVP